MLCVTIVRLWANAMQAFSKSISPARQAGGQVEGEQGFAQTWIAVD